jgi:DHA1 family tetracycline resistance protein-like MFS transporter
MFEPSSGALISAAAGPKQQGRVQGASQSMQSIARIIGPLAASFLYQYGPGMPFLLAGVLSIIGFIYLYQHRKEMHIQHTESMEA